MKQNFIEDNIIILSKQTIDAMLGQEHPSDLIGLYAFYYYTAKWQKTNIIKCSTGYVAKGLNWTKEKVIGSKKILLQLGLIENKKTKNEKGQITGWYIKLNYLWKKETIKKKIINNQRVAPPEGGLDHRVENPDTNALSANSLNALSADNKKLNHQKEIDSLIEKFKLVNPSYKQLYQRASQQRALEHLLKMMSYEKLENLLDVLPRIFGKPYAPVIISPVSLEEKLGALYSYLKRTSDEKVSFVDLSKIEL